MENYAMHDVESSNVASVGHDGSGLLVRFKNGALYRYEGAPASVLRECMNSKSVGSFIGQIAKSKKYPATKVGDKKRDSGDVRAKSHMR